MKELIAILFLVGVALVLGGIIARNSHQRDTIYGGSLSKAFNFLGAALFAVILPSILVFVFVFHPQTVEINGITFVPLAQVMAIALSLSALSFSMLLIHASLEKPALEKAKAHEDHGWTEEDARTSGL